MKIEATLMQLCPKSLRLPVKYHYKKFRARLDEETLYLPRLLVRGKRAIDVGANEGIYSYVFSKICNVVEAFEPQVWCTQSIEAYSKVYQANINIHNVALSNFKGLLTLHIPTSNGDYSHQVNGLGNLTTGLGSFREIEGEKVSINVPVHKLDDYEFKDVSFLKVDVEGHESKVIEGARKTILREKPIIIVEIEQRHLGSKPIDEVFEQINELGYKGSFLYKSSFIPLCNFSRKGQLLNGFFYEKYINNFIFRPK